MKKGFTLIEILFYVGVLGMLLGAVSSFLLFTVRSQAKTRAEREVVFQALRAIEIMTREIKQTTGVYAPTSVFDAHPGQLSLATNNLAPQGETTTYTDFFVCQTQLCQKRESQNPFAITSSAVKVQNLVFHLINSAGTVPSLQIDLTVEYNTLAIKSEYQASIAILSAASLR